MNTFYPLHIGAVGGPVVRWLYVILGLAPAVLSVTGVLIWYRSWRKTNRAIEREQIATPPAQSVKPVRREDVMSQI